MIDTKPTTLWKLLQVLARLFGTPFFDLKVWGTENIPKTGGVLLLPNHQSFMDPVLVSARIARPVQFMAKAELFEGNKIFAWIIRSLYAFPVKQQTGDIGAIREAITRLQNGAVLNIYPEGTRTRDGEIGPILPGVALVVRKAGVPIIPVAIDGSYKAWPKGHKFMRPHPIRLLYGPPLQIEGLSGKQVVELIDRTLREMLVEVRRRSAEIERSSLHFLGTR